MAKVRDWPSGSRPCVGANAAPAIVFQCSTGLGRRCAVSAAVGWGMARLTRSADAASDMMKAGHERSPCTTLAAGHRKTDRSCDLKYDRSCYVVPMRSASSRIPAPWRPRARRAPPPRRRRAQPERHPHGRRRARLGRRPRRPVDRAAGRTRRHEQERAVRPLQVERGPADRHDRRRARDLHARGVGARSPGPGRADARAVDRRRLLLAPGAGRLSWRLSGERRRRNAGLGQPGATWCAAWQETNERRSTEVARLA